MFTLLNKMTIRKFAQTTLMPLIFWGCVFIFVIPGYARYSSRQELIEIIKSLSNTMQSVEKRSDRNTVAWESISIPDSQAGEVILTREGVIIAKGAEAGQVLVLLPYWDKSELKWRCIAGSQKDVPASCR